MCMQKHLVSMPTGDSAACSSAEHDAAVRACQCSQMDSRSEDSAWALESGAALLTVAPMPMPTGFTAMAQGETPTPVKPKVMAEAESWKRFVLDEKKVGALMATALLITWRMTNSVSARDEYAQHHMAASKAGQCTAAAVRPVLQPLPSKRTHTDIARRDSLWKQIGTRQKRCRKVDTVRGCTSSTKPVMSPLFSFSRVSACAFKEHLFWRRGSWVPSLREPLLQA